MNPKRPLHGWVGTCEACGKRIYATRKDARRTAKTAHAGEHMSVYRCTTGDWHIGHINARTLRGEITSR